jgi:hypothetical protein
MSNNKKTPENTTLFPESEETPEQGNSVPQDSGSDSLPVPPAPGGIDLNAVRLSQDYSRLAKTRKLLTQVPVKRPPKHQFFQVHSDPEFRLETMVFDLEGEIYLLSPEVAGMFPDLAKPVRLYLYVTRNGAMGLWPVKLPVEEGKTNPWNESAAEGAEIAMSQWVRLTSNRDMGCYDIIVAEGLAVEPKWPEYSMAELVNKAFAQRYVNSLDHPLVKELSGEG